MNSIHSACNPQIIVASSSHLWLLRAVTVAAQVNSLVQEKQFQLALELAVSDVFTFSPTKVMQTQPAS